MSIEYVTNNHEREFVSGYELTPDELADFDYLDEDELIDGFILYRGEVMHISEFAYAPHGMFDDAPFDVHGYTSDTYFSGHVLNISDDGETYRIARCYSKG